MNNFQSWNRILGWIMFAISLTVYTLTLESSISLWDCGEFASAAFKLQVVHPPGAPFFLMVGRIFSLFAGDLSQTAVAINMLSAFSSAGTVMFTFWITTYFAGKMINPEAQNRNFLILASGAVAALTLTFLDSFWFSAVEAEVYAMSSFFTALTLWAVLKWDKGSSNPNSDRWLVFIAYMIGLALGTHMLNLLVIPVVCLAYYMKRYTITRNGVIKAFLFSMLALGFVMKVIYPGIPWLLAHMDYFFVNSMGLPFYTGCLFAVVLLAGGLGYMIYRSHKKGKRYWNLLYICISFVVLGYGSYAMVIIRSMANPVIDMNDPEDPYKFYGYITREQYGDRPLLYGPYFNSQPIDTRATNTKYYKGKDKYEEGGTGFEYVYDDDDKVMFPRMGPSGKANDDRGYRQFAGMDEVQQQIDILKQQQQLTPAQQQELQELELQRPSFFSNNLRYFFSYQIGYMYIRYFLWNFVGRFNDQQATSGNTVFDGNWYSGVPIIDNMVVGPKSGMPAFYKEQKAMNKFYFLPLILGILGIWYQYKRDKKDFWLVMTLFLFAGVLINVYMNQPPYEPRERDYSLVGSFQTFCIWIGLGVIMVADLIRRWFKNSAATVATAACLLLVPANMAYQNWDDHDRSQRYIGIDMAKNFLENLEPNAILFCNGDNDTYPLWYAQNVENIRTDVRIINMSLLPTEWYSKVLLDSAYKSAPLPLTLSKDDLETGSMENGIQVDRESFKAARPARDVIKECLAANKAGDAVWRAGSFYVPVNKEAVKKAGIVAPEDYNLIVDSILIRTGGRYLDKGKGDVLLYDLITTNAEQGWKRPIYFTSVSGYDFSGLHEYLQQEGLVYRFVPIKGGAQGTQPMRMEKNKMFDNIVNKYRYYGMTEKKNFFLDEKASYIPSAITNWAYMLASSYADENMMYEQFRTDLDSGKKMLPPPGYATTEEYMARGKAKVDDNKKKGVAILDAVRKKIPEHILHMRRELKTEFAITYYMLGDEAKGNEMMRLSIKENVEFQKYFRRWEDQGWAMGEMQTCERQLERIKSFLTQKKLTNMLNEFNSLTR